MKFSAMSERDRRAIVYGSSILALSLFFVFGVKPFRSALAGDRERLAAERETLSRERAAVEAATRNPLLQQRADSAMQVTTSRLFEGRDNVMAAAEMVNWLSDVAKDSRVYLPDAHTGPSVTTAAGVRHLSIVIRAESDLRGILAFLQALETGEKLVRVDRIDLSKLPNASEEDESETLTLNATITAFALPSEPATADRTLRAAPTPASAPQKTGAP